VREYPLDNQTSPNPPSYRWYHYALWPGLFAACVAITASGMNGTHHLLYFNLAYVLLAVSLLLCEWQLPHERLWQQNDGQTFANIAHTLTSKGVVQALLFFSTYIGLAQLVTPASVHTDGWWPRSWPIWLQASLGLVIA
jgi:hypothetical protein